MSFSGGWIKPSKFPWLLTNFETIETKMKKKHVPAIHARPNGFTLDAFLLLLGLAASYPESVILMREASSQDPPEPPDETLPLPLTKQSLKRTWSRALTVTIGATMRGFPAALLLNSRTESGAMPKDRRSK